MTPEESGKIANYTWWRTTLTGIPFLGSLFLAYYSITDRTLDEYVKGYAIGGSTEQTKPLSWFQKLIRTVVTIAALALLGVILFLVWKLYLLTKKLFK